MTLHTVPAIWLIVLIVGLPQLSETVYTPSLPDIAHTLQTQDAMVEYTLTIYLLGFALGSFFWGHFSDRFGRKPSLMYGFAIFILGCIGCYCSQSIEMLMLSRLVQAFGGSTGSVLGQAICRDAFHGPHLGRVYSLTGSALALFPALGPLCGGLIAEMAGWRNIFIFLSLFALIVSFFIWTCLPETHPASSRQKHSIKEIGYKLLNDRRVLGFALIVGGCNGILFSYFAEGSFYLIEGLGLSPSQYGLSFTAIAIATMLGGIVSKQLHHSYSSQRIMSIGLSIICLTTTCFSTISLMHHFYWYLSDPVMITVAIMSQMACSFGICMTTSNALALALTDYKYAIGTASSIFGFLYYNFIALFTLIMGLLHNGTLLPMPLYFWSLSLLMIMTTNLLLKE